MSDKTSDAIKAFLYSRNRPQQASVDAIHKIEMIKGKCAKRVIDANLTNQDYYRTAIIQQPLLDHYENVDWFERDLDFDF